MAEEDHSPIKCKPSQRQALLHLLDSRNSTSDDGVSLSLQTIGLSLRGEIEQIADAGTLRAGGRVAYQDEVR